MGVIGPLVQGSQSEGKRQLAALAWLSAGLLTGALTLGLGVTVLAALFARVPLRPTEIAWAGLLIVTIDLIARGELSPLSLRRQTCATWGHGRNWNVVPFAWGVDLGLGVTTFRVSAIFWCAVLYTAAAVPTGYVPLVAGAYGVGLALILSVTCIAQRWRPPYSPRQMVRFSRPLRYFSSTGLLIGTVYLLASGNV